MNAAGVLDALLGSGLGREAAARGGVLRAVQAAGIEVGAAADAAERAMRACWKRRVGNSAVSLLLIADAPDEPGSESGQILALGPNRKSPLRALSGEALLRALEGASAATDGLHTIRRLAAALAREDRSDLPGLVVRGLLTEHLLRRRFRERPERWNPARAAVAGLPAAADWQQILQGFGYRREMLPHRGHLIRRREEPVAVVHPSPEPADFGRLDSHGRPPEGGLVEDCLRRDAPYGALVSGGVFRLFDARSPAATASWIELDAGALGPEERPWLALLSPPYLAEGGFAALRQEARDYGVALWKRLGQRIRNRTLPALAEGLDRWAESEGFDTGDETARRELEQASLTLLFRLLFVLYAESAGNLPIHNHAYRRRSLTALVRRASEAGSRVSPKSNALWSAAADLVAAMRSGDPASGVAPYDGALFAPDALPGAALLERIRLDDLRFARLLVSLGLDDDRETGVDYSTLEIGHLGNIYESLLGLKLSVADQPIRYDRRRDRYLHAHSAGGLREPASDALGAGALLWQTHEGGRKTGGVYYTPSELVRHLVDGAVRPAFREHLARVEKTAETAPRRAARELLDFSVVDPACGSGHFLVEVLDALADETARFLARRPLPALRASLARLRESAAGVPPVEDMALLRRLLLKHCVFGVDVSPMGAEIAAVSLWLAAFVPGLSLSYLGGNITVGNSLIGVADRSAVVEPTFLWAPRIESWLKKAAAAAATAAAGEDRTPDEVRESDAANRAARAALAGLKRLFDLWTSEPFGQQGNRELVRTRGHEISSESGDERAEARVRAAAALAAKHAFFHWPVRFPGVFRGPRRGFDAVVGNPPWEEITVEELGFFALFLPGVQSLAGPDRELAVAEMRSERPDLGERLAAEKERARAERIALGAGEFDSSPGDPDLYKYFCQRYRTLAREGGFLGVVLPRSAFNAKGSAGFRKWLHRNATVRRVDFLLNNRRWVFDTHPQYSVALVTAKRTPPATDHRITVAGTADSEKAWRKQAAGPGVQLAASAFGPDRQLPLIRSQQEADLLARVRTGAPFPLGPGGRWKCFAVRELDETNDRRLWRDGQGEGDPSRELWKGASFDQYDPRGREARRCPESAAVWSRVRKPRPGSGQRLASLPVARRRKAVRGELDRARVAFRDVTNRTNSRTVLACLVPPGVFLTNTAPYLAFVEGCPRVQAACVGILNSLPFDWQARRFVEIHLSFFQLEGLIVPDLGNEDFEAVSRAAARLSAADDRFADFAAAAGVSSGPLSEAERARLRAEIDARVARGWNLAADDLRLMFEDFTPRAVSPAYRSALLARLEELR